MIKRLFVFLFLGGAVFLYLIYPTISKNMFIKPVIRQQLKELKFLKFDDFSLEKDGKQITLHINNLEIFLDDNLGSMPANLCKSNSEAILPAIDCLGGKVIVAYKKMLKSNIIFDIEKIRILPIGEGEYYINGNLKLPNGEWGVQGNFNVGSGWVDLRFTCPVFYLNKSFYSKLSDKFQEIASFVSPKGSLDIVVELRRNSWKEKFSYKVLVKPKDISVVWQDLYEVQYLHGEVEFTQDKTIIKELCGKSGDTTISIRGDGCGFPEMVNWQFVIDVKNLKLDEKLRGLLNPQLGRVWKRFSPSGKVDITGSVESDKENKANYKLEVYFKESRALYEKIPLSLTDINGKLVFDSQGHFLYDLVGKHKDVNFEVKGVDTNNSTKVDISAQGLKINENLIASLPTDIKSWLQEIKLRGTCNLKVNFESSNQDNENYKLNAVFLDGDANPGIAITDIQGFLNLECERDYKGSNSVGYPPSFFGDLNLKNPKFHNKKLSNLTARFIAIGDSLSFYDISGNASNGSVSGKFEVNTRTGEYGGFFDVKNLSLGEYLRDIRGGTQRSWVADSELSGDVNLMIKNFQGRGKDISTLSGSGVMKIENGHLWRIPLLSKIFNIDITKPFKKSAFDSGLVKFDIKNKSFKISEIGFYGKDAILAGKGSIDFDGKLDLYFDIQTDIGIEIFPVKILERMFDLVKNGIFSLHASGEFDNPVITTRVCH